jgi:N-acetylglucosamine malate deacetylase 1
VPPRHQFASIISRRQLLKFGSLATLGSLLTGSLSSQTTKTPTKKTILGLGAHYDDCIFGIPGILLKAVAQGHRVVIISILGDYSNWKKVEGYEKAIVKNTIELCKDFGVEKRFLDFKSMNFEVDTASQRIVAQAVAEIRPDIAFMLWSNDRSVPHQRAAQLSKSALLFGDYLLNNSVPFKKAVRVYEYDNGPRHTIHFIPNMFVDISKEWPRAAEWLGRLMAVRTTNLTIPRISPPQSGRRKPWLATGEPPAESSMRKRSIRYTNTLEKFSKPTGRTQ